MAKSPANRCSFIFSPRGLENLFPDIVVSPYITVVEFFARDGVELFFVLDHIPSIIPSMAAPVRSIIAIGLGLASYTEYGADLNFFALQFFPCM